MSGSRWGAVLALALVLGCGDEPQTSDDAKDGAPLAEAPADVALADAPPNRAAPDAESDAVTRPTPDILTEDTPVPEPTPCVVEFPGGVVPVDLQAYRRGGDPSAFARIIESERDLLDGDSAIGRLGDVLIGNEKARFVIQQPGRHICQCPFGGDLVDADIARAPNEEGSDSLGGVCLLFNLGRTLRAERIDLLSTGEDGCPAIVALSGPDATNDFLDIPYMMANYGFLFDLPLDPREDLPVWITAYYILEPGARSMRLVTAMRNDGDEVVRVMGGDMVMLGGAVEIFNPTGPTGGFGIEGGLIEPLDFFGLRGPRVSYAYAPPTLPTDEGDPDGPGGGYLAVSGVIATVLGNGNVVEALAQLVDPNSPLPAGVAKLEPGDVWQIERLFGVGTTSLATVTDEVYASREQALGSISGVAFDEAGSGLAGARLSFVDPEGRARTQSVTASDGTFEARLPGGTYSVLGLAKGRAVPASAEIVVSPDEVATIEVVFSARSALDVAVRDPDGKGVPAKVVVYCEGTCPVVPTPLQRDVNTDWEHDRRFAFTDATGKVEIPLAAGSYRVVVTRGPEYSLWPADAKSEIANGHPAGGLSVTLTPGEVLAIDAVIARVVDTDGWMSGDFHVHAARSPDAPVSLRDRVLNFMADGVDVLVSTDHDHIFDFAPVIADLGAGDHLVSIIGEELTTFTYGHYNAFPLDVVPDAPNGGAMDWAGDTGPSLHPAAIFEGLGFGAADRVVQINHALGGYFGAIDLNPLTGVSLADPTVFHIEPSSPDPTTGDTGLWSESFTAMELYNGYSVGSLHKLMRYWLSFLNRGFRVTGTAVSDTHNLIKKEAGGPRSFVRMTDDEFAPSAFAVAVNEGRVFGSNGPILEVELRGANGESAGLGETLAAEDGDTVSLLVTVQTPAWFGVDRVRVLSNALDAADADGWISSDGLVEPIADVALEMLPEVIQPAHEGGDDLVRHVHSVEIPIVATEDAYFVVLVTGEESGNLTPYCRKTDPTPLAFSNPVFLDLDGDGWSPPIGSAGTRPGPIPPRPRPTLQRIRNATDIGLALERIRANLHGATAPPIGAR